jgi:integrase
VTRPALTARTVAANHPVGYVWFDSPRGLALRITPNGERFFAIRYRLDGRQFIRRIAAADIPLDTVRSIATAKLAEVAAGRDPFPASSDALPLSEVCERHVQHLERVGNQRTGRKLRPERAKEQRRDLKRWLAVERLRDVPADKLTEDKAARWLLQLRADSGRATANRARSMLRAALRLAGYSTAALDGHKTKPTPEHARKRVLSDDELRRLHAALEAAPIRWRAFFTVLARTGLRKSELRTLRADDVDLDAGVLTVRAEARGKTNTALTVRIDDESVRLFRELWQAHPPLYGYAFPSPHKRGQPLRDANNGWEPIRKAAGIDDVVPHDLRRTFGTMAALAGLSAESISAALGNSSSVTARHYIALAGNAAVIAQVQDAVAARMNAAARARK